MRILKEILEDSQLSSTLKKVTGIWLATTLLSSSLEILVNSQTSSTLRRGTLKLILRMPIWCGIILVWTKNQLIKSPSFLVIEVLLMGIGTWMDMEVIPSYGSIMKIKGSMSNGISKLNRESKIYLLNKLIDSEEKIVIIVREIYSIQSLQEKKQFGYSKLK